MIFSYPVKNSKTCCLLLIEVLRAPVEWWPLRRRVRSLFMKSGNGEMIKQWMRGNWHKEGYKAGVARPPKRKECSACLCMHCVVGWKRFFLIESV